MRHLANDATRQRGGSLAGLLVGLLVGLLAGVTILTVFADAEALKRNAVGVAEAGQTALLALTTLGTEVANAGNNLSAAAAELDLCPDTGDIATSLRPIPLLITAGANDGTPDAFVVNYGTAAASAAPMPLVADAPSGAPFRVASPLGFAANDAIVVIGPDGRCALTTATAVSPADREGVVDIAHPRSSEDWPQASTLLDLGPRGRVQRVRYDVVDGTLRSRDLLTPGAAPNPLASNVVNLKLQYGIGADGDGAIDRWVGAEAAPWDAATLLSAPAVALARIKAVRIGLIVRSDVYDRDTAARYRWQLFDCGEDAAVACPGRLAGTLPARYRYRSYETTIPLRNTIWNSRP